MLKPENLTKIVGSLNVMPLGVYLKLYAYLSNPNEPDELTINEMMEIIFCDDLSLVCVSQMLEHLLLLGYVSKRRDRKFAVLWKCHYPPRES